VCEPPEMPQESRGSSATGEWEPRSIGVMTETLPDPPELDPAALAGTNFSRTRRGFEPTEVHAALGRAADALRAWNLRDAQFRARLDDLEQRLTEAEQLDEARLTAVLGAETAKIVTAARDAAAEIRLHAEEEAARLLQETSDEATRAADALTGEAAALRDEAERVRDEAVAEAARVRSEAEASAATADAEARARHDQLIAEAEGVLAERTAEAEQVAAGITEAAAAHMDAAREDAAKLRTDAEDEAEQIRRAAAAHLDTARDDATQLRSEAEQDAERTREAARDAGRSMVNEARAVRERILRDLVERRATARRQIEAARAGRDVVIESLRSTIAGVNATIDGLADVDAAASASAAAAIEGMTADTEAEVADLLMGLGDDEPVDGLELTDPPADAAPDAGRTSPSGGDADAPVLAAGAGDDDGNLVATGSGEDEDEDEADDDAPGATVHDLFARIRAEGIDENEAAEGGEDERAGGEASASAPADAAAEGAHAEESVATAVGQYPVAVGGEAEVLLGKSSNGAAEPGAVATVVEDAPEDGSGTGDTAVLAALDTTTALLDRRDQLLAPVEKSISRVLRRLASDEQNELLDQLRRAKRGRPDVSVLLPADPSETVARFVDALTAEFSRAAEAGAALWSEMTGSASGSLFGDDERLVEQLTAGVAGYLELHRAHLERTFADAEAEGLDASELADRVRAAYRDWRSGSLADLAGDLATLGLSQGQRRAAGPGTPWRWVVDNGGLPCADGEDNALAGAVPCEEPFPTGDLTPPAHPGCRCILAPAHL
jgi:cell division septum initiation protein DivIVA